MSIPAVQESSRAALRRAALPVRRAPEAAPRRSPNYATREETLKAAERIMNERAELFRRLADA